MGQRYSCDTVAALHWAIAEGESESARRLLLQAARHREGGDKEQQLYLSYRGETAFGVEIRYSQTALALAIQFRQWQTFRNLLQSGLSASAQQRMLVPTGRGQQCCTRDFGSALELLVWALTQATYCPAHLGEAEVQELLCLSLQGGAAPDSLPPQLLRQLGRSAVMDIIGAEFLDVETTTALQRSALGAVQCLMRHGLSPRPAARALGGQLSLYELLLCFLADAGWRRGLRSRRKLRQALCLLLNAFCCTGVQLPSVASLGDSRSRNTPVFWYYYSKIRRLASVGKEDVGRVLRAHEAMASVCCRQPPRLALAARHRVRRAVTDVAVGGGDFVDRVGRLPLRRRLRQQLLFLDEESLEPEISSVLRLC